MTVLEFKNQLKVYVATLWVMTGGTEFSLEAAASISEKIFGLIPDEAPPEDKQLARVQGYFIGMLLGEAVFRGIDLDQEEMNSIETLQIFVDSCDQVMKNLDLLGVW